MIKQGVFYYFKTLQYLWLPTLPQACSLSHNFFVSALSHLLSYCFFTSLFFLAFKSFQLSAKNVGMANQVLSLLLVPSKAINLCNYQQINVNWQIGFLYAALP